MKKIVVFLTIAGFIMSAPSALAGEEIRYDFEESNEGWKIPDWAFYQHDHVAREIGISEEQASSGTHSLKVNNEFPGKTWAASLIELQKDLDLTGYEYISVDIYLPKKAPRDLIQARIIMTVGDGWLFTEMRYPVLLERGKWVTVKARLESSEPEKSDWKGRGEKRLWRHIDKVVKIAVRVEYDAAPPTRIGPKYEGPFYIDNMIIK